MTAKRSIRRSLLLAGLLSATGGYVLLGAQSADAPSLPELSEYGKDASSAPAEPAPDSVESGMTPYNSTEYNPQATSDDEVTVGELKELMNLPATARISEAKEDLENPPSLFNIADQESIRRIFGEKPTFVYFPVGVDPMVIPWVRARIVAEELFEEAAIATANKDYDKAERTLREIREKYPETEVAANVPSEVDRVRKLREADAVAAKPPTGEEGRLPPPQQGDVTLPDWVKENTTGVLLGDDARVIVENDFLAVGDAVPRYPTVRVKSITPSEVTFEFQKKDFTVDVDGSF